MTTQTQAATMTRLNTLTQTVTAFAGWTELRSELRRGYVPTFSMRSREQAELGLYVQDLGYRVFWIRPA